MKKAQFQMGETIFVVMVIIILIVIGFVFVVGVESDSAKDKAKEYYELDSVALGKLVSNIPEITCSSSGVKKQSCFDITKLKGFESLLENNANEVMEYYFERLGNVNITIHQIYPEPSIDGGCGEGCWNLYINNFSNVPDQNNGRTMKIPILLEDPVLDKNAFGILYVTKFGR
jgi:hypothetical protein